MIINQEFVTECASDLVVVVDSKVMFIIPIHSSSIDYIIASYILFEVSNVAKLCIHAHLFQPFDLVRV